MKKRILHVSDLKLNYDFAIPLNQLNRVNQLEDYILNRFTDFLETESNRQTDYILLTGDFFESLNSGIGEIESIGELLQRFPHIRFIIAPTEPENHDDSWYYIMEWPSNVKVLSYNEHLIDEENNLLLYAGTLDESLKECTYQKIRLLSDGSQYEPIIGDLYCGLLSNSNYMMNEQLYSPGSFVPLDFESLSKNGYIEIIVEDFNEEINFHELKGLQLKKCDIQIDAQQNLNDIIQMTKDCIQETEDIVYYRFNYRGNLSRDIPSDFQNIIKDSFNGISKGEYINLTNKDYYIQEIEKQNDDNLIGLFIKDIRSLKIDENERQNIIEYGLDYLL